MSFLTSSRIPDTSQCCAGAVEVVSQTLIAVAHLQLASAVSTSSSQVALASRVPLLSQVRAYLSQLHAPTSAACENDVQHTTQTCARHAPGLSKTIISRSYHKNVLQLRYADVVLSCDKNEVRCAL